MDKLKIQRERTKIRLFSGLITVANLLNIPIIYESQQKGLGRLYYWTDSGKAEITLFHKEGEFILKNNIFFPYVLAHELGHYFCYKNNLEQTEKNANKLGYEICNSILTSKEQSYLRLEMDMYFIMRNALCDRK